jgi:hypothetical protein
MHSASVRCRPQGHLESSAAEALGLGAPEQGETRRRERETSPGTGNSSQNVPCVGLPVVGSAGPMTIN